MYDVIFC